MMGCSHGSHTITRHNHVTKIICNSLVGSAVTVKQEPRSILKGYGQGGPDILWRHLDDAKMTIGDVVVAASH